MIKIGKYPFMECSSRGDKRFSAFYAKIKRRSGKSIEGICQAAKILKDGRTGLSRKEAKGKYAVNYNEIKKLYSKLWDEYIAENPELLGVLKSASGLSDMFGVKGCVCQAIELWRIRNMKNMIYKSKCEDHKACFCIGPKKCNDTNCELVKIYRERQSRNCRKKKV